MNFHVVTIFPEMLGAYLGESMMKRAIKGRKISVKTYNPRDFTKDKHKKVDHKPYGGGPGMVMSAEPILAAVKKAKGRKSKIKVLITSPRGKKFDTKLARKWLKEYNDLIIICGRYEGIDQRVKKATKAEEVSIGDYVLTGGELPAMVMIDSISRAVPGVLGNEGSLEEKRREKGEVYTRPEVITHEGKRYRVPKVLVSGNHKEIDEYRRFKEKK